MSERTATSFGVGMTVSPDNEVVILLVVSTDDDEQVFVPLEAQDIDNLTTALTRMLGEAELVNEAVRTMPPDAAKAYVENWIARDQAPLN